MEKDLILAHDLGTTGNKATLFNSQGGLVASSFHPYETFYPKIGWAEQNPEDWCDAFKGSTAQLLRESKEDPGIRQSGSGDALFRQVNYDAFYSGGKAKRRRGLAAQLFNKVIKRPPPPMVLCPPSSAG